MHIIPAAVLVEGFNINPQKKKRLAPKCLVYSVDSKKVCNSLIDRYVYICWFMFSGSAIFASIPSASQDSGLPQDSGQGRRQVCFYFQNTQTASLSPDFCWI
jgi:hypothetical protein